MANEKRELDALLDARLDELVLMAILRAVEFCLDDPEKCEAIDTLIFAPKHRDILQDHCSSDVMDIFEEFMLFADCHRILDQREFLEHTVKQKEKLLSLLNKSFLDAQSAPHPPNLHLHS